MSSEPGRPSESRNRRRLRLAAVGGVLLVLLASLGCGLKGDPLPPIRPPEPEAEAESAEDAGEEPEADGGGGEDDDDSEEEGDAEEDGEGAQRPA